MTPRYPSQQADKFLLRLPDGLRRRIKTIAAANNRSMNAEVVLALAAAYPEPTAPESVNQALLDAASAVLADWSATISALGQNPSDNQRISTLSSAIQRAARTPKDGEIM